MGSCVQLEYDHSHRGDTIAAVTFINSGSPPHVKAVSLNADTSSVPSCTSSDVFCKSDESIQGT